jgi:spore germination cell wall hydrolase CwlJ-like protein
MLSWRYNSFMKTYLTFLLAVFATVFLVVQEANQFQTVELNPVDKKELACLANNIYFEARGESITGKFAVGRVTENRLKSGKFGNSMCQVVQQSRNNVCQFSWWCKGSLRELAESGSLIHVDPEAYAHSEAVANAILAGADKYNPVGDAIYYHADYLKTRWNHKFDKVTQVEHHIFYKEKDGI